MLLNFWPMSYYFVGGFCRNPKREFAVWIAPTTTPTDDEDEAA
jgi:hypothetical protein